MYQVFSFKKFFLLAVGFGIGSWLLSNRSRSSMDHRSSSRPDLEKKFSGGQHDIIDQASWESFPASDSPAY